MKLLAVLALSFAMFSEAHASPAYRYNCIADSANEFGFDFNLKATVTGAKLTFAKTESCDSTSGMIDRSYHPRSASNQNKVRYKGFDELAGGESLLIYMLVDKTMLSGGSFGYMNAQASGEVYSHGSYRCTRE